VALITLAGKPLTAPVPRATIPLAPDASFESPYGIVVANSYGMCAARHMYEYGTTSEQLAWIKVAASHHAQHNPHAMLREVVTVEDVINSPVIADPLHRMDCCVVSDGGGALIVASPEVAATLKVPKVAVRGAGETLKGVHGSGEFDLTTTGAAVSGPLAFAEAGVAPADIKYASIYDSFTITVLLQLEDLGFCAKGEGPAFVRAHSFEVEGSFPLNTSGGQLSVGQAGAAGGSLGLVEAVRQLTGRPLGAQVPDARHALVSGFGMINFDRGLCTGAAILAAA